MKGVRLEVPFSMLPARHSKNRRKFLKIFKKIIKESDFILGESVEIFESKFSEFVGSKYAVGVANGSDAIRLALLIKNLPQNGGVGVAANTYFAAASAIIQAGLIPEFFDVDLMTRFPTEKNITSTLTNNTVALIRSHLYGEVDTCQINQYVEIHDCSQAHGTLNSGVHVGKGHLSTYSFYPGKNLGAFGDAGMITTDSYDEYQLSKAYRNQGTFSDRYLHEILGFNSRMDTIQAEILRIKLLDLRLQNNRRIDIANLYTKNLSNISPRIRLFSSNQSSKSSFHIFQIFLNDLDLKKVQQFLKNYEIASGRHYPIPLHLQPALKKLGYQKGDFPNAELLARQSLSLPIYPELTDSQVNYVSEKLIEIAT